LPVWADNLSVLVAGFDCSIDGKETKDSVLKTTTEFSERMIGFFAELYGKDRIGEMLSSKKGNKKRDENF